MLFLPLSDKLYKWKKKREEKKTKQELELRKIKEDRKPHILLSAWTITFSKRWVSNIMYMAFIAIFVFYVDGTIGHLWGITAKSLALIKDITAALINAVIVTIMGYFGKSLWETHLEAKDEILKQQLNQKNEVEERDIVADDYDEENE